MHKLKTFCFIGNVRNWLRNCSQSGTISVVNYTIKFANYNATSSVPRCNKCGPLFRFNLFTNDVENIFMHANDFILYIVVNSDADRAAFQNDFIRLFEKVKKNSLKINSTKCRVLHLIIRI